MTMESSIDEFLSNLTIKRQNEFRTLADKKVPVTLLLCWFSCLPRRHGEQKLFLNAMVELFSKKGVPEERLYAAYKKHLQRIQNTSPEVRQKILQKADVNSYENSVIPVFSHNYKEPATLYSLLGPTASFDGNADNKVEKLCLGEKGLQVLSDIYSDVLANLDDFTSFHLARIGLQARARWTDESNIYITRVSRERKGRGVFLVLTGSEFSKKESPSCVKFKHIQELRQELIHSEVLLDGGDVYKFIEDYPFSSPSLAASVLAGANLNGLRYWKDEYGRSLGHLRKGKFKMKRGPGRPRKSS